MTRRTEDLVCFFACLLLAVGSIVIIPACARADPPPPAPVVVAPTPPVQTRPEIKPAASPTEVIDRRIADLEGQLATAKADRQAAKLQAIEAEDAAWRSWARWIAGLGLPLCAAAAALGCWFGLARLAIPIAGAAALACVCLLAYAEALRWMAWVAPGVGLLALATVAVVLLKRRDAALAATARLGDQLETGSADRVAKLATQTAQIRAGVHGLVQRARGKA